MAVKISYFSPFTRDRVNSLLRVISSKPTGEFMTAFMHLTHSICSRASVKRLCPLPDDREERPSSKQSSPPRIRNSLNHSLLAGFSRRGRIPEKCFKDGVFKSLTHNSGSASAISELRTDDTSLFSPEIFRHLELGFLATVTDIFQFCSWSV